mmetsp:Transcript_15865/g.51243  ORF Transcript_15865/g.51243 Transcript_15865/m.51243 type:complete len:223 (-) Transcript_15865:198-866(-)
MWYMYSSDTRHTLGHTRRACRYSLCVCARPPRNGQTPPKSADGGPVHSPILHLGPFPPVLVEGLVASVVGSVEVVLVSLWRDLVDRPPLCSQGSRYGVESDRVDAEVRLAHAGARAHLDALLPPARHGELDVVDVALLERLELDVQIAVRLLHDRESAAVDEALPGLVLLDRTGQGLKRGRVIRRRPPGRDECVHARQDAVLQEAVAGGGETVRLPVAPAQP